MEGSLGGEEDSGFYLFSDPVIQFPRLGFSRLTNMKLRLKNTHQPPLVIYGILVESKLCMKFVILFVTIKGRYITTI